MRDGKMTRGGLLFTRLRIASGSILIVLLTASLLTAIYSKIEVYCNSMNTCRAISMCRSARESFPPDRPKSRQSPSSIILHSLTACPTSFMIFLGGTTALTDTVEWVASAVGAYVTPAPLRVLPQSVVTDDEEGQVTEGVILMCGRTDEEEEAAVASVGTSAAAGAGTVVGRSSVADSCALSLGFSALAVDLLSFGRIL
jgi:hypothetical protein